jgi:hypothetical protein
VLLLPPADVPALGPVPALPVGSFGVPSPDEHASSSRPPLTKSDVKDGRFLECGVMRSGDEDMCERPSFKQKTPGFARRREAYMARGTG